ncbi:putative lipid-transfer protein DIR1 [Mercurialis annua]|uniref:putative lipid-transfer protein DIR1 n=1 Tax=Mercurialis annua TaxID=3986 RepID=UPI00215E7DD0|nr:putative lipid-transfer protein DIR1 [Mercurialis annua]
MGRSGSNVITMWITALLLMAAMSGAKGMVVVCDTNIASLVEHCRPSVIGLLPPHPTKRCCRAIRHANLSCLCKFKFMLPMYRFEVSNVMALPGKCSRINPCGSF